MTIEKQYYIRVDYEPATDDNRRQDGTYLIKWFDEVQDEIMAIDARICMVDGTPASSPYIECIVGSLKVAEHIDTSYPGRNLQVQLQGDIMSQP